MSTLEQRLSAAEAVLEIMQLKSKYAILADGKYTDDHRKKPVEDRDRVAWQQAECFTEDGEFDAGEFGCVKGRQPIFENFRLKPFIFAMHIFVNPAIEVDPSGDTASGRWVHHLFVTQDDTRMPVHGLGYTQDRYRRVAAKWLFSRVETRFKFLVPFTQPWSPAG